jgi:hypothetical protein
LPYVHDVILNLYAERLESAIYFAIVFVFGDIRLIIVAPPLGEVSATLIELTLMLIASWFICTWMVRRFAHHLLMCLLAFVLMIASETILGTLPICNGKCMFLGSNFSIE